MLPLFFILLVTALSVLISHQVSPETSWFAYYKGAIAGIFISGIILHLWNKRTKAKEEEKEKRR